MTTKKLSNDEVAVYAHDITVCMERHRTAEFDQLHMLGLAVRLALHLRGVPPLKYEILKRVALHLLNFSSAAEVQLVVQLLAEADFVSLATEGTTIKTVVPQIPYFDEMYGTLSSAVRIESLNESEQLTLELAGKLSNSPLFRNIAYGLGAEKKLVDCVLDIGREGGFILQKRARGKDILLSPTHFSDNHRGYADLVAAQGIDRVKRVLELLRQFQGWPLAILESDRELGGCKLTKQDLAVIRALAGDGFVRPPALTTTHAGTNHFLFGPRPGVGRLPLHKRSIYEKAMALVAAVRQGQLLPNRYAIRYPEAILRSLRDKKYLNANSEAWEQYRQVAVMGVARLTPYIGSRARVELIEMPENYEALELALQLIGGTGAPPSADEDIVLALRKGEEYVESLIGRKLIATEPIPLDEESRHELDTLILGGFA